MKRLNGFLSLALATWFMLVVAMPAAAIVVYFEGTCGDQDWFSTCGFDNNWQDNHMPEPGDDVFIEAEHGRVFVDGNATVQSVDAQCVLRLEASTHELHLTSGTSTINGLGLYYNSKLEAQSGVTVNLSGNVNLWSDVYGPGRYVSSGNLNLSYGRLWSQATLENQGAASITAGSFQLGHGNTVLENHGTFTVEMSESYSEFRGPGSSFINSSSLVFNYTGSTDYWFFPNYDQQPGGSLRIQNGTVRLNSIRTNFAGGTVTVDSGAVLVQMSNLGGDQDHRYSGITHLNGGGWLVNQQEVVVDAQLNSNLGPSDGSSGDGGYRLSGASDPMILNATIINWGRFHLNGGRIEGPGTILNLGWFYTASTGGGTIACDSLGMLNLANVHLASGLTLESEMDNVHTIRVIGGGINGNGTLKLTQGSQFIVEIEDLGLCTVSTPVTVVENAKVKTAKGHLELTEYPVYGVDWLSDGEWIAEKLTTIKFNHTIRELRGAVLRGEHFRFPNVLLSAIKENSMLRTKDWETPGGLDLDNGNLEVEEDGEVRVSGNLNSIEGSKIGIEDGGALNVTGDTNNGTGIDAVVPELAGIVVLTKAPGDPATITTPLLNNHGRILPGGYDGIGTMHLVGDLVQHSAGELWVNLNGALPGSGHDQVTVDGNAALSGNLSVSSLPGFMPANGQQFTILTTTGLVTGAFETIVSTDGITYNPIYNSDSVVLVAEYIANVDESSSDLPESSALSVPFPNPFNPRTTIDFALNRQQRVNISVFDMAGRRIDVLTERIYDAGSHAITWDGRDSEGREVSPGTYLVRLRTQDSVGSKKVVLLR
jgi:hypothetical protein